MPFSRLAALRSCFNSQPREGGWPLQMKSLMKSRKFQLAAARRRLGVSVTITVVPPEVSTRSRAKAAGVIPQGAVLIVDVSTRSRAKAAG